MKTSTLSVVILIALVSTFMVQAEWPHVTVGSQVADHYLGFGTGNVLSKDPVVQSDLAVSFKNGLYIDLWNSRSLKGKWDDGSLGNEVDYQLGWKGNLATNWSLNAGVTYFDEPKAFRLGAGDILYPHVYLTRDFKHLSVIAGYENFTTMPGSGFQGGHLMSLGVSKYQLLFGDKVGVRASAATVYDTGTLGSSAGFILRGSAGIDWNITKRLTWNVAGVNWYVPLVHDKRDTDAVWYSGFTFRIH